MVCRYNSQTGKMDFHVYSSLDPAANDKYLRAQLKLSHAIHSVHSNVSITHFSRKVRPDRRPAFSVPRSFNSQQRYGKIIATTNDSVFLRPAGDEAGRRLPEYPEDEWPGHFRPTTTAPGIADLTSYQETLPEWPTDSLEVAIAHSTEVRDLFHAGHFPDQHGDAAIEFLAKISRRLLEPRLAPYSKRMLIQVSEHHIRDFGWENTLSMDPSFYYSSNEFPINLKSSKSPETPTSRWRNIRG